MALIKCPECGKEVSSTSFVCPNCGKELRKPKRSFIGKIFLWIFFLFNIFMILWLVGGMSNVADIKTSNEIEEAGKAVGAGLAFMSILFIWVCGAIITGLLAFFTRPKR
ncbi:zinc ribbon domain-containing protein [Succinatimonas hippei]|uniref:Putative zinc-ribbon domain-containing protein n=1 Tax=Succinatimonas hippei (strain DSM 22608 / JCM 16073 / KCTC 15190 / YIT 12066) TaxID=762983 RepID=E8LLC5_SUCHY|nr:zinc ribbon domain-containing protein [Succinatimonas hippei]EFY06681.1 hypothetical protein HMPREF9444_01538 [Succinatimonas hippei YIT 12066]MCL1604241.1 zinc ribbon domain-containing protein [Succinatimonas hippei]